MDDFFDLLLVTSTVSSVPYPIGFLSTDRWFDIASGILLLSDTCVWSLEVHLASLVQRRLQKSSESVDYYL